MRPRRTNTTRPRVSFPIEEELRQQTLKALSEAAGELRYALGLIGPSHPASIIVREATTDIEVVLDIIKD